MTEKNTETTPNSSDKGPSIKNGTNNAPMDPGTKLWEGGYSPKAMIGTLLLVAAVSIALIAGAVVFQSAGAIVWQVAIGVIVALWLLSSGLYLYRRWGTHYQLTSQRFIHQRGLLTRTTDRIEVIDIDDVTFTQGIVDRFLGTGTIKITGSDRTDPELSLLGIDEVNRIATLIDDVRRKERHRRSIHIEAV
jgi:membrane protein YdbS with pleckstrin-like domain